MESKKKQLLQLFAVINKYTDIINTAKRVVTPTSMSRVVQASDCVQCVHVCVYVCAREYVCICVPNN